LLTDTIVNGSLISMLLNLNSAVVAFGADSNNDVVC
jgi:hypothetical protein